MTCIVDEYTNAVIGVGYVLDVLQRSYYLAISSIRILQDVLFGQAESLFTILGENGTIVTCHRYLRHEGVLLISDDDSKGLVVCSLGDRDVNINIRYADSHLLTANLSLGSLATL